METAGRKESCQDTQESNWCEKCSRSFDRSDHFVRHIQSHEDLRPHQCPWCPKSFNRGDLLHRHKKIHGRGSEGHHGMRASRACRSCVSSKSKCTDQKPCKRCLMKGIPCDFTTKEKPRSRGSQSARKDLKDPETSINVEPLDDANGQSSMPEMQEFNPDVVLDPELPADLGPQPEFDTAFWPSTGSSFLDAFVLPGAISEIDSECFDLDLETLQILTQPFSPGVFNTHTPNHPSPASSRFEVFKRSPWLWTPVRIDHAYAGQENLKVNENALDLSFGAQERFYFQSTFTAAPVDEGCRDRMLFMIFNSAKGSISLQSFPSVSFLDRMVQVYFGWNNFQATSWIHASSFVPAETNAELLGVILAAGSSSISIPAVWKLGYALQERSRLSLSASIENDNSRVRELCTMQAYMLWVSMGLWSGFKRNMELAESFLTAPVTMLRRYGCFSRQPYAQSPLPSAHDEGDVLEVKWKMWIHQESLKRAAIFGVITDLRCSMAYLKPPNCSLTELSCPLPASRDLWLAPSAAAWKQTFLSRPPIPNELPFWATIMQDSRLLENLNPHVDTALIALVIIHGFWPHIWAYHESQRFFRSKRDQTSQARTMLWLSCQQQDLVQSLDSAKTDLAKYAFDPAQLQIVSEFSLMALNVSPRELQQFAGRLGESEAETTHLTLKEWMKGPEFKAAVWHAGQIFRAARALSPTQLRDFFAIALYQASLTLWAYGILSKDARKSTLIPPAWATEEARVILDGVECAASAAFLSLGRGDPGITVGPEQAFCPLTEVDKVMGCACGIFRENFGIETAALPPLLENLICLMADLGSISMDFDEAV